MSPCVLVFEDVEELASRAARWLVEELALVLDRRGAARWAVAGGSTPGPVYRRVARQDLDWSQVEIYFGDERCVGPADPDSNYRMFQETFLEGRSLPDRQVHRMRGEDDPEQAARDYESLLPEVLDVITLGVGEDGHTASLFPGGAEWQRSDRRVVPVVGKKPPPRRLTVTPRVIRSARRVQVLAAGAGKAEVLARALRRPEPVSELPIRCAWRGTWFLDAAAAAALPDDRVERRRVP